MGTYRAAVRRSSCCSQTGRGPTPSTPSTCTEAGCGASSTRRGPHTDRCWLGRCAAWVAPRKRSRLPLTKLTPPGSGAPRAPSARRCGPSARPSMPTGHPTASTVLEEAVAATAQSPARLEHAKNLMAWGSALRRRGRPTAAREPLARAAELATVCGARPLAERAHDEVRAAGGRRLARGVFGPDALTPSERRVARLGRCRQHEQGDRATTVRHPQDRRGPPFEHVSQARHHIPERARGGWTVRSQRRIGGAWSGTTIAPSSRNSWSASLRVFPSASKASGSKVTATAMLTCSSAM